MAFRYDLISGKVNHVAYNPRRLDELYHRYSYDAENRLTLAETSTDSIIWERDARYEYYKHGPLARTVLGNELVQGLDYAYTLQGWLKGVNSTSLDSTIDMGQDARAGELNRFVTKDAIGFNLNYYTQDYAPIGGGSPFPGHTGHMDTDTYNEYYRPLYNGNISSMAVNISKFPLAQLYNYKYDQLNRITRMDAFTGLSGNSWSGLTLTDYYRERVSYDPNGNILKYMRHGDKQYVELMDSLRYTYYPGSNKLRRVNDNVAAGAYFKIDVEDQGTGDNYTYDAIGNMTSDAQEGITDIKWTVYGKIKEITRTPNGSSPASKISYTYDAGGNRISKKVEASDNIFRTWYVRDAQGNVMATYTANGTGHDSTLAVDLQEQHIYGSSRLGILTRNTPAEGPWYDINNRSLSRGLKQYELTNHLGNVLTTITDKKLAIDNNADDTVDYYVADVLNAIDYYPFGMPMPGRTYDGTTYRYGFNGKENDNEVKGMGNQQDYGMRIYDPRIGRFLSVDPLQSQFPDLTPYQYAGNTPIQAVDLDGMEPQGYMEYWRSRTDEYMTKYGYTVQDFYDYKTKQVWTVMHYPNTKEYYYWATKYEGAHKLFSPANTNLNKGPEKDWTGSFKQFIPHHESETAREMTNIMLGVFGGVAILPFAVQAGTVAAAAAVEKITIVAVGTAVRGYAAYARVAPAIGSAGRAAAEFLDESGTVGAQNAALSGLERSIVKEAKNILNSKEFEMIKDAHNKGIFAEVKIGGRTILYEPDLPSSGISLHGEEGFVIGGEAFTKSPDELGKTILHELYRLFTQGTGQLGVDNTRPYTDAAKKFADKAYQELNK
jgi:RHS repeat-associated protein